MFSIHFGSAMYCLISLRAKAIINALLQIFGWFVSHAKNGMIPWRQLSVFSLDTIFICSALALRYVDKQHYGFTCFRLIFKINGPKYLLQQW